MGQPDPFCRIPTCYAWVVGRELLAGSQPLVAGQPSSQLRLPEGGGKLGRCLRRPRRALPQQREFVAWLPRTSATAGVSPETGHMRNRKVSPIEQSRISRDNALTAHATRSLLQGAMPGGTMLAPSTFCCGNVP